MLNKSEFQFFEEFLKQFSIVQYTIEGLLKILWITEDDLRKQNIITALEENNAELIRLLKCYEKYLLRKKIVFLDE